MITPLLFVTRDHVVAVGGIDDDHVGLTVAAGAAGLCAQVDRDLVHVGSGQIVDRDRVGAAPGDDVDVFDTVDVHGHRADVADQPQSSAVGRKIDVLTDVRAVELQRVDTSLPLDHVATVTRVPNERVVTGAHEGPVAALAADEQVVAGTAYEQVIASAAIERET